MDEREYQRLADDAFRRIEDGFKDVDADVVDFERTQGDVLTITLPGKKRCIVNTQRPTRQIWMAASSRAWHFSYDAASGAWHDDKDRTSELYATLARIIEESSGLAVAF
jgi:CyaY protein